MCFNLAFSSTKKTPLHANHNLKQGKGLASFRNQHPGINLKASNFTAAPTVDYRSSRTYKVGITITEVTPTSTNVAALGYKASTNTIGSGFSHPVSVAADAQGNVYVADDGNSLVLKKIPAGGGAPVGMSGGFNNKKPTGVTVDAAGNVFAIDQGNIVYVMRADNNTLSTLQVGGGNVNNGPNGIAIDANSNVYVTNSGNNSVKRIPYDNSPDAPFEITTGFNNPTGIAVDATGNVFVADQGNHSVKMIPKGTVNPAVVMSNIAGPFTVSADVAGNVYIVKLINSAIQMLPVNGGNAITVGSSFNSPAGLAIGSDGKIYVADAGNSQVKTVDPTGGYFVNTTLPKGVFFSPVTGALTGTPTTISPTKTYKVSAYGAGGSVLANLTLTVIPPFSAPHIGYTSPNNFNLGAPVTLNPISSGGPVLAPAYNNPIIHIGKGLISTNGIASDAAGNFYVTNSFGFIEKVFASTDSTIKIGTGFIQPSGVAVDKAGNVFVADEGDQTVKKIPVGGGSTVVFASGFTRAAALTFNSAGDLFVADGNDIKKIPAGSNTPVIFAAGFGGRDVITVDQAGNFYVDSGGSIVKISPDGKNFSIAASGFGQIEGIAVDVLGNLYVSDTRDGTLKMVPAGSNTPVVLAKAFAFPRGLMVDGGGNIFVLDYGTPFIKKFQPSGGYYINALPAGLSFNSTTGAITGTPTATSVATNYTVTAYNGLSGKAVVNIKVSDLHNANLSNLQLSNGVLSPAFTQTTTNYTAIAATSIIKVIPTADDVNATIKVNGTTVASGSASASIPLLVGDNTITTVVTALDGTTIKTYTIKVTRLSDNALLTSLKLNPVTPLTVISGPDYRDYTTTVPNTETSVKITATAQDATSTIKVNGIAVASGTASAGIPLNVGVNVISTVVTAQDGVTTKTYSIKFTRLPSANANLAHLIISSGVLTPVFVASTTSYTALVSNATASVVITPTASDSVAKIKVNGTTVVSGTASAALPLVVGLNTVITIVTAQNGTTSKTYTVNITRTASNNALLTSLKLNPVTPLTVISGPDFRDYTTTVPNTETGVKITPTAQDATSIIKVNGVTIASGTASANIPLTVGANVIKTVVTAQDGVTAKTYTITFTRLALTPVVTKYETTEQLVTSGNITVHQNLSPNGDGKGDVLLIDGIAAYPENKLQIMNRDGVLVYEAKGYDNETKAFDGHSSTNGKLQQAGTYFYSLEYKDGAETRRKTGFILIKY